ncbi:hypothetical protein JOB18_017690 [Solea senegalensis]|nr:hypothetical protein JOB18_017690 [Solea senegalensis]KAG7522261.1 hypothetical protein JOB18_017690 [Solea senegalensis]
MMSSVSVTQVFMLSALLYLTTALPVRNKDGVESYLTEFKHLTSPRSLPGMNTEATLRQLLDRRRQLGDIEFSNRYAEFLRSKAKHSSICSFLRRMQGFKKSGEGGDVERVNLLLKQYMCPSIFNNWPTDL